MGIKYMELIKILFGQTGDQITGRQLITVLGLCIIAIASICSDQWLILLVSIILIALQYVNLDPKE